MPKFPDYRFGIAAKNDKIRNYLPGEREGETKILVAFGPKIHFVLPFPSFWERVRQGRCL